MVNILITIYNKYFNYNYGKYLITIIVNILITILRQIF